LPSGIEAWGRITPLADDLLLEVERRSWNEVARGSAQKLIKMIAGVYSDNCLSPPTDNYLSPVNG